MKLRVGVVACACALTACEPAPRAGPAPLAQHRVTAAGALLDGASTLREPGWATSDLLVWDPSRVADPKRLRQWDFFTLSNAAVAVNVTLADVGIQLGSVNVVDLATGATAKSLTLASTGELSLSTALGGDASVGPVGGSPEISFQTTGADTVVTIDITEPLFSSPAHGQLTIHRRPQLPFLSVATPFADDPTQFFYEQKIPGLTAEGTLTIDATSWTFDAADTSAVMDWGRGAWPSTVHWLWATGSGALEGKPFALNLGTVFGDDAAGTENVVFYEDTPTKLGRVGWTFDPSDPMKDWGFEDDEGRLTLTLHPSAPEISDLDLGTQYTHVRKGYGTFTGTVVLDDGRTLAIHDIPGAAEEERAAW